MSQQLYESAIAVFDDPRVSVEEEDDFHEENILPSQNLITFTYSDRFGKEGGFDRNV
jgi:hypothetical protein